VHGGHAEDQLAAQAAEKEFAQSHFFSTGRT